MLSFIAHSFFTETVIFLSYILICIALLKRRFSLRATVLAVSGTAAVIVGIQAVITLSQIATLALTLLPLTAYLPFSVLLYLLSDCGVFETAAVCSVGGLAVLTLKSLNTILNDIRFIFFEKGSIIGNTYYVITNVVTAFAAAVLVFIAFRFIRKAFRCYVFEDRRDRLLISVPMALIFLMLCYYLNSTTDTIILIITMLIALSVFLIIAKLLTSEAQLIQTRRSEKEMSDYLEIQRRGYDILVHKIEAGRVHRHDMRHHLTIIEGLAKQGECEKIIEYTGKMNDSLSLLENVSYCKNPEINAVLSEYITRGKNAGCRVTQKTALPQKLPFAEDDVCIVLANSIENAINACAKLPEEQRYINISTEFTDGHRLLISVKNPCKEQIAFDENGLPAAQNQSQDSDEHGIGLYSISRTVEKYNGFMRCKLENGEFVFKAAMFYEDNVSKSKFARPVSISKRVMTSLLGLGFGTLLVLNIFPAASEAASTLFSVNIRTIHSLVLGWGDNSLNINSPEFEGNGSDGLNNAVTKYTDEAKKKFLWYFNRRYDGYVAEDMRYTVIRDDDKYFIAQFNVTINAGGSMDYSRWITFDKSAGKVLELSDLFKEDSDYINVISAKILEMMIYRNENENGSFFVEGDDAFTGISEDANFYIDSFDRLVIVFDEYEVAPGFMGSPEFYFTKEALKEIVR